MGISVYVEYWTKAWRNDCFTLWRCWFEQKIVSITKNVVWVSNRDKDGKRIKGFHPVLQHTTKGGRDRIVPLNEKSHWSIFGNEKENL